MEEVVSEGRGREGGIWFGGDIDLGVIPMTVKVNIVFMKNVTKRQYVNDKKQGTQDRTLWHTSGE